MKILGIETSCDETAAAVVENGVTVLSSSIASSATLHRKYGGIVPEVAARRQLESLIPVMTEAVAPLKKRQESFASVISREIDAVAVTVGPGLIGSLLIGVEAAKTLSYISGKPLLPVNHVLAHIYANFIQGYQTINTSQLSALSSHSQPLSFPAIALVVSGGHTELFLMESKKHIKWLAGTIDDAAGEAFDKTARLLGFDNQGGAAIERAAKSFNIHNSESSLSLPRPMMREDSLNFSFSGLKTAVMREWKKIILNSQPSTLNPQLASAFAYEIQESITDVLVSKTLKAVKQCQAQSVLLAGGVTANQRLRDKFLAQLSSLSTHLFFHAPPIELCTDNAVTTATCAYYLGLPTDWRNVAAQPNLSVEISL